MAWSLAASDEVVDAAVPLPLSASVPSCVLPSAEVTCPVGVPAPGEFTLTVAVNVTDCPTVDGVADEATIVVRPACLTVGVTASRLAADVVSTPKLAGAP